MGFCVKCGTSILEGRVNCLSCYTNSHLNQKKSDMWYILPILFGFLGGLIMYGVLFDESRKKAKKGLLLGFILTILYIMLFIIMGVGIISTVTNDDYINCEFLGYQVDSHRDTLQLSALIGDKEGLLEYEKLQTKYNENCI